MTQLQVLTGFHLVTPDLARLTQFYAAVLGFVPDGAPAPIPPAEMALLGLRGTGQRQVLRVGAQRVVLDAFAEGGAPYPGGDAAALWFQHLALVVPDMGAAYARVRDAVPISRGGPQQLPPSSGGVAAFKFRDPDGHPLELLHFPPGGGPAHWHGLRPTSGQVTVGIDHSAISSSDVDASTGFYAGLGLVAGPRGLNTGPAQERLDGLDGVRVTVAPMQPATAPPHLELLAYEQPRGAAGPVLRPNDVAATRLRWRGNDAALLRDPDGHLHQVET